MTMNRRQFTGLMGAGLGVAASGALGSVEFHSAVPSSEQKAWARKHFRGFENILLPSFTPDLTALDEAGIRYDVRQSLEQGVFSLFCAGMTLSEEELVEFVRIAADEAGGRAAVGTGLRGPSYQAIADKAQALQQAGCTHVLVPPPYNNPPATEAALLDHYETILGNTPLPVVLWATDGDQFRHLHPSNVPIGVLEKAAELPNAVALKMMSTLPLPTACEIGERLQDKLMIGCVHLGLMPMMALNYGAQWSGAWTIEALQSPDKPYVVQYLDHLLAGRVQEATALYWKLKPAYDELYALMSPLLPKGGHPFLHLKYYQWAVGGNGGLLREPEKAVERDYPLTPQHRQRIRQAFRSIGIEPRQDDSRFVVGEANAKRGVTPADLPRKPLWVG